mmetsp:Transcript_14425/g.23554  ORF Transcript_14425/g.23554 Transcript_14425/m.23554 type:complete len:269 (+) Transcript_14425:206-1012(+)
MATLPTNLNNNIHITTSALDGHLNNIRSNIPPSIRAACFPDSTSTFLRNLLLAMGTLNVFLFLGSLLTVGVRFMGGFTMIFISMASCIHLSCIGMVLGKHIASETMMGGRLAHTLRNTSARYGSDVFVLGALFGSTLVMATLMRFVSTYYGGVSACVANAVSASASIHGNLTGGYATNDKHNDSSSSYNDDACGASGPVGFVSFLSGLLFWLNAVLASVLFTKRDELLSGDVGPSNQYDEIGVDHDGDGRGFAGDFPSSSTGMRTMNV